VLVFWCLDVCCVICLSRNTGLPNWKETDLDSKDEDEAGTERKSPFAPQL